MLKLVESVESHKGNAWSVAWEVNGRMLASCGQDKTVNIYHITDSTRTIPKVIPNDPEQCYLKLTATLEDVHQRTIRDICWSPCSQYLAVASFDGTVTIWRMKTISSFECITTIEGHESEVKSVAWCHNRTNIATSGRDKQVMIWSFSDEREYDVECESVLGEHTQDVKRVIWHPNLELLLSTGYDDKINLYKYTEAEGDWAVVSSGTEHESTVWAADFDSTGQRIVSCSSDLKLRFYDNLDLTKSVPAELDIDHERSIYDVSWNKTNGLIATACGDDFIRIIKEEDGHRRGEKIKCKVLDVKKHDGDVNRVQWSPQNSNLLASCGDDGCVKLWAWINP